MSNIRHILDENGYLIASVDISNLPAGASIQNSTDVEPSGNRFVNGQWITEPDNRGSWYNPSTNEQIEVPAIGVDPPAGWVRGVAPALPIADARAQAWDRIKAARNGAEFGTFTWNGLVFDGDSESQRRIQGAAQLAAMAIAANVPWSIAWTLADNTTITMSAADMIAAGTSLAVSVAGAHNVARALRTQIDAATTQEELDAIVWPGGEL